MSVNAVTCGHIKNNKCGHCSSNWTV